MIYIFEPLYKNQNNQKINNVVFLPNNEHLS